MAERKTSKAGDVIFKDLVFPGKLKLGDRVRLIWEGDVASLRRSIVDGTEEVLDWENESIRIFKVDR